MRWCFSGAMFLAVFMPDSNITQRSWIFFRCRPTSGPVCVSHFIGRGSHMAYADVCHRQIGRIQWGNLSHSLYTGCRNQQLCVPILEWMCSWAAVLTLFTSSSAQVHFLFLCSDCLHHWSWTMFTLLGRLLWSILVVSFGLCSNCLLWTMFLLFWARVVVNPCDGICTMSTSPRRMCWSTHLNTFEPCPNCLGGSYDQDLSIFLTLGHFVLGEWHDRARPIVYKPSPHFPRAWCSQTAHINRPCLKCLGAWCGLLYSTKVPHFHMMPVLGGSCLCTMFICCDACGRGDTRQQTLWPNCIGHSLPRLFRFYFSCGQQLLWRVPAHVLPCGHIAAANFPWCRLHFIICAECALVSFLVIAMHHKKFGRLGRPATVCRRPGWGTRTTPRLHHWSLTSPVTACRAAANWHISACRYCNSMTGYTRRDTPWMQLVQATLYSVQSCLRQVPFTACVVALACLLISRPWISTIVNSW